MTDNILINWTKDSSSPRSYSFQYSKTLSGFLKRKGLWNSEGTAEMGKRKLRFMSSGKATMKLTVYDTTSDTEVGVLNFYWKDFQRSDLKLANGSIFQFKSFSLFKGGWSWVKEGSPDEQLIFRVDSPLHRSGTIEYNAKDLSAEERDILMLLGLQLQHYLNTWLMTITFVIVGLFTSR